MLNLKALWDLLKWAEAQQCAHEELINMECWERCESCGRTFENHKVAEHDAAIKATRFDEARTVLSDLAKGLHVEDDFTDGCKHRVRDGVLERFHAGHWNPCYSIRPQDAERYIKLRDNPYQMSDALLDHATNAQVIARLVRQGAKVFKDCDGVQVVDPQRPHAGTGFQRIPDHSTLLLLP